MKDGDIAPVHRSCHILNLQQHSSPKRRKSLHTYPGKQLCISATGTHGDFLSNHKPPLSSVPLLENEAAAQRWRGLDGRTDNNVSQSS